MHQLYFPVKMSYPTHFHSLIIKQVVNWILYNFSIFLIAAGSRSNVKMSPQLTIRWSRPLRIISAAIWDATSSTGPSNRAAPPRVTTASTCGSPSWSTSSTAPSSGECKCWTTCSPSRRTISPATGAAPTRTTMSRSTPLGCRRTRSCRLQNTVS